MKLVHSLFSLHRAVLVHQLFINSFPLVEFRHHRLVLHSIVVSIYGVPANASRQILQIAKLIVLHFFDIGSEVVVGFQDGQQLRFDLRASLLRFFELFFR